MTGKEHPPRLSDAYSRSAEEPFKEPADPFERVHAQGLRVVSALVQAEGEYVTVDINSKDMKDLENGRLAATADELHAMPTFTRWSRQAILRLASVVWMEHRKKGEVLLAEGQVRPTCTVRVPLIATPPS